MRKTLEVKHCLGKVIWKLSIKAVVSQDWHTFCSQEFINAIFKCFCLCATCFNITEEVR